MKQILIITRITGNSEKDEFRSEFYPNRKEPVTTDFEDLNLDIYSGFDLYDDDIEEVATKIQSLIDRQADEVLIVVHCADFDDLKVELLILSNGASWQIREYSSEDANYKEITEAFQGVITDSSKVEKIDKLFSPDYTLEAKLELLHNCLMPENIPAEESLDKRLKDYSNSFRDFKKKVESIRENLEKENAGENKTAKLTWNNKDYLEALTQLRIALLGK
jgi:hypothetical protein